MEIHFATWRNTQGDFRFALIGWLLPKSHSLSKNPNVHESQFGEVKRICGAFRKAFSLTQFADDILGSVRGKGNSRGLHTATHQRVNSTHHREKLGVERPQPSGRLERFSVIRDRRFHGSTGNNTHKVWLRLFKSFYWFLLSPSAMKFMIINFTVHHQRIWAPNLWVFTGLDRVSDPPDGGGVRKWIELSANCGVFRRLTTPRVKNKSRRKSPWRGRARITPTRACRKVEVLLRLTRRFGF